MIYMWDVVLVDADSVVMMMFLDASLSAHDASWESCGLGRDGLRSRDVRSSTLPYLQRPYNLMAKKHTFLCFVWIFHAL